MKKKCRCEFYPEVECLRVGKRIVKCEGCRYLEMFEEEMCAEEERFFDEVDALRKVGLY